MPSYSQDGRPLAIELRCLEASLDESSEMIAGAEGTVAAVAWSPDGTWLASGDAAGRVRLHRPGAAGMSAVGIGSHEGAIWSLAVSPDGQRLASAGADGRVRIAGEVAVLRAELEASRPAMAQQIASKLLGREVKPLVLPLDALVPTLTQFGISANVAGLYREMNEGLGKGLVVFEGKGKAVRGEVTLERVLAPALG
jgi:hypothetical protein